MTLVCEDGEKFEAHKFILAASSPLFHNIFKEQKHPHPLIYMRRMKSNELAAVMDFLYLGESNIYQDDVYTFLNVAEELQLKGLTGRDIDTKPELPTCSKVNSNSKMDLQKKSASKLEHQSIAQSKLFPPDKISEGTIAIPRQFFSGELDELDEQIKSMMLVGQNILQGRTARFCAVCGKEGHQRNIKDHIEANHIPCTNCTNCEKTFRSRASLRMHKVNQHK